MRGERPGHAWYQAAKEWDWIGRAYAWDASERERLRGLEQERRFDAREYRLGMIDWLIAAVFRVLQVANLDSMEPKEARAWLPTMRVLFKDLINAQRAELGLPAMMEVQAGGEVALSADDLQRAQRELQSWQDGEPHPSTPQPGEGDWSFNRLRDALADLYPDESSARRVASQAGLALSRIRLTGVAVDNWHAILREAENTSAVGELIAVVQSEYGRSRTFAEAVNEYQKGAS